MTCSRFGREVNAVKPGTSATSASLISSPVSGSSKAFGWWMAVQPSAGMPAIAFLTVAVIRAPIENRAPARRAATVA